MEGLREQIVWDGQEPIKQEDEIKVISLFEALGEKVGIR